MTKKSIATLLILSVLIISSGSSACFANEPISDSDAIQSCLNQWGKTPFEKTSAFRVLSSGALVLGTGPSIDDHEATKVAELVLVKAGPTVFGKRYLKLLNPEAWYCWKGSVTALGSTRIDLACAAKFASSEDGSTILASSRVQGETTVLGSTSITRIGCK